MVDFPASYGKVDPGVFSHQQKCRKSIRKNLHTWIEWIGHRTVTFRRVSYTGKTNMWLVIFIKQPAAVQYVGSSSVLLIDGDVHFYWTYTRDPALEVDFPIILRPYGVWAISPCAVFAATVMRHSDLFRTRRRRITGDDMTWKDRAKHHMMS